MLPVTPRVYKALYGEMFLAARCERPACALLVFLGSRFFAFLHVLLLFFWPSARTSTPSCSTVMCAVACRMRMFLGGVGAGESCMRVRFVSMCVAVCVVREIVWRVLWLWCIPHEWRCQASCVRAVRVCAVPSPSLPVWSAAVVSDH